MLKLLGLPVSIWPLTLLLGDLVMFGLSVLIGFSLSRMTFEIPWFFIDIFIMQLILMGLIYIVVLYVANLYDHYQDFRRQEKISTIILSSLIGTLVVLVLYTFPSRNVLSRV